MSNLVNYLTLGKRLGEVVTLPYNGDMFTSTLDGSVWKAANNVPLAYSSTYAGLLTDAPSLITAAVTMNGPFANNTWGSFFPRIIVGATAGGSTWMMIRNNSFASTNYYTSTDAGSTWTQRTLPQTGKLPVALWDGTNFVLYFDGLTTNAVYESTDAITWTSRTGISLTPSDIIYNGSVYLCWGNSTTAATSPDRTTWTSRTTTATGTVFNQGLGNITWNAGAGLFIGVTNVNGQYQTSPDGITWTARTALQDIANFRGSTTTLYASNSTITVAVGAAFSCATTTDGINWTSRSIAPTTNMNLTPAVLYYDGTRFVLGANGVTFYSTDGATWTRATRTFIGSLGVAALTPTGVLQVSGNYGLHSTDVTSTSNTNIVYPVSALDAGTRTYVRIL